MSDFPNRKAWLEYRARPKYPWARWVDRTGKFDRSRKEEKRSPDPAVRRQALIERCARRRRESWKLERNNPFTGRAHGMPA